MGFMRNPWAIVLLIVLVILLFGANKLPGLARNMGQSMRIFKSEVEEMRGEDRDRDDEDAADDRDRRYDDRDRDRRYDDRDRDRRHDDRDRRYDDRERDRRDRYEDREYDPREGEDERERLRVREDDDSYRRD
ncbi:Sec-independent protein translocase subunit TatA [Brachybacterium sp. UMB0905]|uniref:Sec-independent protein translocase subunit TatA n=1 Tax=Brachybacterium sp. UMB0905 TaxID=2069310 RepID=UPI000C7FE081|nr:Sec-independent protein translocase subunit TatA [Brachybacterium sp. UMB0905]PMC75319.1 twin-arginine translocase TatA/TatE family subunit [Brachybacterium sp. UMB0905]